MEDFLKNTKINATGMTQASYKALASRYISISSKLGTPGTVSGISQLASAKISKSGSHEKYLTPQQKEMIGLFSYAYTKLKINGHFGSGKTLILIQGVRKLYQSLMTEFPAEKHIIFFSSLGCIRQTGHPRYLEEENFLEELKEEFGILIKKKDSSIGPIIVKVGSLLNEIMNHLGIYIRCDECLSKRVACNHDAGFRSKQKSMVIPGNLKFRVLDLIRIFQKTSELQNVPISNIHLFLDEVCRLPDDWTLLDAFSKKHKNVVWLAMNSEFYQENQHEVHLPSYQEKTLSYILSIKKLNCSIKSFFQAMTGANERMDQIRTEKFEQKSKKLFNIKPVTEIPNVVPSPAGHVVEGVTPRLLMLRTCFCKNSFQEKAQQVRSLKISAIAKMMKSGGNFHSGKFCQCSEQRIKEVLQMSISTMFDLQHIKDFVEVCKGVKNMFEIEFWATIFKKNQSPY